MIGYISAKCIAYQLTDIPNLLEINRFKGSVPLDLDLAITKGQEYKIIGISFCDNFTSVFYFSDGWMIDSTPIELFDLSHFEIPSDWTIHLDTEIPGLRQIAPARLMKDPNWFGNYVEDEPETLALVDEIIDEIIKELQAEEDAKNPKKDPFDDYWGL